MAQRIVTHQETGEQAIFDDETGQLTPVSAQDKALRAHGIPMGAGEPSPLKPYAVPALGALLSGGASAPVQAAVGGGSAILNQLLGLEKPGVLGPTLGALLPFAGKAITGARALAGKIMPGATAARHAKTAGEMLDIPGELYPQGNYANSRIGMALQNLRNAAGGITPLPRTEAIIQRMLRENPLLLQSEEGLRKAVTQLQGLTQGGSYAMPQTLEAIQLLGEQTASGGRAGGVASAIYQEAMKELRSLGGSAADWAKAMELRGLEKTRDELAKVLGTGVRSVGQERVHSLEISAQSGRMQRRKSALGQADDVGFLHTGVVHDRHGVEDRSVHRIGPRFWRDIGRRIATRRIGDAAITPGKT